METLTYGYKKPQNGDRGTAVFEAIQDNTQQVNDHAHNGVNSARINTTNLEKTTVAVLSTAWNVDGNRYSQLLTLPGTLLFDNIQIFSREMVSGEAAYPEIEKITVNSFKIYTNDNTVSFTLYYF